MNKIEKEVQRYIKSYTNAKGSFFKVIISDGYGSQVRKQGFLSKTDATNFAVTVHMRTLSQVKGIRTFNTAITFKEYAEGWLENKKRNGLKEGSAMRYQDDLKYRLNPFFGGLRLNEIEKSHLRNFIFISQSNKIRSASLAQAITVFKSIIKQAEVDDVIIPKGITSIPTPRHIKADPKFWDISEINYFLNATKNSPFHLLWKFALYTGMRAGEIAGLKWDCVHSNRSFGGYEGAIEIKRMYNQKTRQLEETTKNGDRRVIPILPEVKEILASLESSDGFVFGGSTMYDSSHFNRQLQVTLKKLSQIPLIKFHGLRHSFCSYLDSTGMSRRIVSEIMGHRDLNTTNRYSHVNNKMLGYEMTRWLESQSKQNSNKLEVVNF